MSADVLREAARLMRERAKAATEGPWKNEPDTLAGRVWVQVGNYGADLAPVTLPPYDIAIRRGDIAKGRIFEVRCSERYQETREANYAQRSADAAHITSWHPAVALAVADVLDKHVDRIEATGFVGGSHDALVAVASAYLGESA